MMQAGCRAAEISRIGENLYMKKYSEDFLRRMADGDPSLDLPAPLPTPRRKRFVTALRMENESAQEADMLGFQSQLLVQCSLPYRRQPSNEWTRRNGRLTLTIMTPKDIGLPYGTIARLLLIWVVTEAVRTQSRRIDLHDPMIRFMRQIGIAQHANGKEIQRFKDQVQRLFSSTISTHFVQVEDDSHHPQQYFHYQGFTLTDELLLWWDPHRLSPSFNRESYLELSEQFYHLITDSSVPIDLRGIQAIKGSALALDIYSWLIYRLGYLKSPTRIPWDFLREQFGGEYASNKEGRYGFKREFTTQLGAVLQIYTNARVDVNMQTGVTLRPSPLHIDRK
jgi:hypothetical protein